MEVFEKALGNVMPMLELKVRRVGGANYQVPVEVSAERKLTLGLRWIVNYSRLRHEPTMELRLAHEIMDAANGTAASRIIEKKVRMAVENTGKAEHTLRLRPMQPGIVFEKILINLGGYKPTHLGMLESPYVR